MKTRSIEVDDDTATALTQRAAERGVSVPELEAELVTLEASRGRYQGAPFGVPPPSLIQRERGPLNLPLT
jgi:hypothetical protein